MSGAEQITSQSFGGEDVTTSVSSVVDSPAVVMFSSLSVCSTVTAVDGAAVVFSVVFVE